MSESFGYTQEGIISESETDHIRHTAVGTLQGLFASALSLPTGLVTAGFLTRKLGPESYGLLTVTASIITFIVIITTMGFGRTAVKFVAEAKNWRVVAPGLVRAQLLVSTGAALLLIAVAPILAAWLSSVELANYICLYALNIPIFALQAIYISILIGQGHFGRKALLIAGFWLCRLVLIFLFVGSGLSVNGAILASIGASTIVAITAYIFVGESMLGQSTLPFRRLWDYAMPLFFHSAGQNFLRRLDLLAVKALSGVPQAAGFYGAAQNLSSVMDLLASSLSPLLLAKVTQLSQQGKKELAAAMSKQSMRVVFCLLPFAAIAASTTPEIVVAIYGQSFGPSSAILALLVVGSLGFNMTSLTSSMLIAAGRPGLPLAVTGPFVPIAIGVHLICIPRFGATGAAATTMVLAWLGAIASIFSVCKSCQIRPPVATFGRSILVSGLAYIAANLWPADGLGLLLKLSVIGLLNVLAFWLLGEFSARELALARSMVRWRPRVRTAKNGSIR